MAIPLTAGQEILLFEPESRGHAREWMEHLIGWLVSSSRAGFLSVVAHPDLAVDLAPLAGRKGRSRIRIIPLTPSEAALCNSPRLAVSGFARWKTMRRYLRKTRAAHGFFMSIDHLSLPLCLGLTGDGLPVSGILFRPSLHYERTGRSGWKERLRDLRKDLLYRGMLRNPAVKTIWSLDPDFPSYALDRYAGGEKVRPVPDPICPVIDNVPMRPEPAEDGIDRTTFLLFGVLTQRKGVFGLLDAAGRIETRYAKAMNLVLAGHVDPAIRDRFDSAVVTLREKRPELSLTVDDRYLPRPDLARYVANADIVLAPYERFVGSSGVILWAANAGKPVLTQAYGLLGRQVSAFGLGLAVDTMDPSELASAMISAVRNKPASLIDPDGVNRFVESHSSGVFAGRIMQDLLGFSFEDTGIEMPFAGAAAAQIDHTTGGAAHPNI